MKIAFLGDLSLLSMFRGVMASSLALLASLCVSTATAAPADEVKVEIVTSLGISTEIGVIATEFQNEFFRDALDVRRCPCSWP